MSAFDGRGGFDVTLDAVEPRELQHADNLTTVDAIDAEAYADDLQVPDSTGEPDDGGGGDAKVMDVESDASAPPVDGQGGECNVDADCDDTDSCTDDLCLVDYTCVHVAVEPCCGNGQVEDGEECDDGGLAPGDGCDSDCQLESPCPPGYPYLEGYCWMVAAVQNPGLAMCVDNGMQEPEDPTQLPIEWNEEFFHALVSVLGYSELANPFDCCGVYPWTSLACSTEFGVCRTCGWYPHYTLTNFVEGATGPGLCSTGWYPVYGCLPLGPE